MSRREAVVGRNVEINTTLDASSNEFKLHGVILLSCLTIIGYFFGKAEIHPKAWANVLQPHRDTTAVDDGLKASVKALAECSQAWIKAWVRILFQSCRGAQHGCKMSQISATHFALSLRSQVQHDFALAHNCADGHASPNGFTQNAQIGHYTKVFLSAAQGDSKGGQDFIKEQQNTIAIAKLAAQLNKTGLRDNAARVVIDGLKD